MFLAFLSSATRRRGTLDHVVRCPKNRVAAAASETVYAAWLTLHNLWTMKHRSAESRTEATCTGIGEVEPLHNYLLSSPLHRMLLRLCNIVSDRTSSHAGAKGHRENIFIVLLYIVVVKIEFFFICAYYLLWTVAGMWDDLRQVQTWCTWSSHLHWRCIWYASARLRFNISCLRYFCNLIFVTILLSLALFNDN